MVAEPSAAFKRRVAGPRVNLVLLRPSDFVGRARARVTGRRARHIREVHRAGPGDQLAVGLVGGLVGTAVVVSSADDEVVLEVVLETAPPPPNPVDLLLAMPRPKVLRRVLQSVAALGVKRIVLVNAWRVEKSYFDTPALELEAIEEDLVLGLEQARDTVLPEVHVRRLFKPFVEDELASWWPGDAARLLPHPTGERSLEACRVGAPGKPGVVAVGPEGGWTPYEVGLLGAHGFEAFSLGPRILRVETAIAVALGQVELARRVAARPMLG